MKREVTLKEIKKLELNILLELDKFCKKENLRYYLAGGTLLGAIRHKGFIPWDDDIDVCMPRNDYELFVRNFRSNNEHLKIKSNLLESLAVPFSKLVDMSTIITAKYSKGDVDKHLWIDILPVDGLPDDLIEVNRIYKRCDFYRIILGLCDSKLGKGTTNIRRCMKFLLKPIAKLYGKKRCISKIEKIAMQQSYEFSRYVGIVTWGLYGSGERMPKSEFEKRTEVEFEGYKFPAFACWDSYLKGLYGDYMQLPPENKRATHNMKVYIKE